VQLKLGCGAGLYESVSQQLNEINGLQEMSGIRCKSSGLRVALTPMCDEIVSKTYRERNQYYVA
jgi:hypothetical protein